MTEYVDKNVQRLLHMIEAIKRLGRMLTGVSKDVFQADERLQDATAFDISTIGEAAAHISPEFQAAHPEIPWGKMAGMRNRLVHVFDYEQIDYDIVWEVATVALPNLKDKIIDALKAIPLPNDFTLPAV